MVISLLSSWNDGNDRFHANVVLFHPSTFFRCGLHAVPLLGTITETSLVGKNKHENTFVYTFFFFYFLTDILYFTYSLIISECYPWNLRRKIFAHYFSQLLYTNVLNFKLFSQILGFFNHMTESTIPAKISLWSRYHTMSFIHSWTNVSGYNF